MGIFREGPLRSPGSRRRTGNVGPGLGRPRRPPTDSGGPGAGYISSIPPHLAARAAAARAAGVGDVESKLHNPPPFTSSRPDGADFQMELAAFMSRPDRAEELAAAQVDATLALAAATAAAAPPSRSLVEYETRSRRAAQRLAHAMERTTRRDPDDDPAAPR